jgi:hypothetical protein
MLHLTHPDDQASLSGTDQIRLADGSLRPDVT